MTTDLAAWCIRRMETLALEPIAQTGTDLWLIKTDVSVHERLFDFLRSRA